MNSQVFLDLDGVIIDFHTAAIKHFGLAGKVEVDDIDSWHKLIEITGLTETEFWDGIPEEFWRDLKLLPWAKRLLSILYKYKPCLLTCPSHNNAGVRQDWIRRYMPDYFYANRYLIGPGKEYVARQGSILIDDSDINCEKWRAEGGTAWTFPRPWNKAGRKIDIKIFLNTLPMALHFTQWDFDLGLRP